MKRVETKTILIHGRGLGKSFYAEALRGVYANAGLCSVVRNIGSDREALAVKEEFDGRVDFLILTAGHAVDVPSLNVDQVVEISGGEGLSPYPKVA